MKGIHSVLVVFALLAFACSLASAFDPSPLQDFCVAINDTKDGGMHSVYVFRTSLLLFTIMMLIMPELKDIQLSSNILI